MDLYKPRMSIFEAYQYLFYRIYVWQLSMFGEQNDPKFVGMICNSMFLGVNLLTLVVIFKIITSYKFRIEEGYAVIGMLLLYIINYFLLLYDNKSKAIIAKFSKESEIQRKRRTIWCWVYVIATHLLFFVSVMILSPQSK